MQKYWLPWLVGMPAETTRAICSLIFGGVFEKFPKLSVAFAHGGGSFPYTLGRIKHGFDVSPDLVQWITRYHPIEYVYKFWDDSLVHDENAFLFLTIYLAMIKFAWGAIFPFPLGEHRPGELIESLQLEKEIKEKLLANRPLRQTYLVPLSCYLERRLLHRRGALHRRHAPARAAALDRRLGRAGGRHRRLGQGARGRARRRLRRPRGAAGDAGGALALLPPARRRPLRGASGGPRAGQLPRTTTWSPTRRPSTPATGSTSCCAAT